MTYREVTTEQRDVLRQEIERRIYGPPLKHGYALYLVKGRRARKVFRPQSTSMSCMSPYSPPITKDRGVLHLTSNPTKVVTNKVSFSNYIDFPKEHWTLRLLNLLGFRI